jgi:hypothetical protein
MRVACRTSAGLIGRPTALRRSQISGTSRSRSLPGSAVRTIGSSTSKKRCVSVFMTEISTSVLAVPEAMILKAPSTSWWYAWYDRPVPRHARSLVPSRCHEMVSTSTDLFTSAASRSPLSRAPFVVSSVLSPRLCA